MSMVLNFLPRQALIGNASSDATYYSEIFDVTNYSEIEAEARVFAAQPATVSVEVAIEGTTDPRLAQWDELATLVALTGPGKPEVATVSKNLRFVRVSIKLSSGNIASVEIIGVARESS